VACTTIFRATFCAMSGKLFDQCDSNDCGANLHEYRMVIRENHQIILGIRA
jgi:hypothetical protein